MANYLGYGLKAAVSGFQTGFNMAQQKSEMDWQKKQRKLLEDKQAKMLEVTTLWNAKIEEVYADKIVTEEESAQLVTIYLSGGYEFMEHYKGAMDYIKSKSENKFKQELEWMDLFFDWTEGQDPNDLSGVYDDYEQNFVTTEKSKALFEARRNIEKKKSEIAPEKFQTAGGVKEAYPEAGVKYSADVGGYVPVIGEEVTPKEITFNEKRFNWRLEQYNLGHITFDQFLKGEGMYIAPEKSTGLEKSIQDIRTEGQRAGIDPAKINKAIQDKILGTGTGGTTTPPSFKTLQDIKGAFKTIKNKAEYDSAVQSYNASKEAKTAGWTPPPFNDSLTSTIKKVESAFWADYVNKDGKLKSKTDAEEFNTRVQQYIRLIEEAKRAGIDVTQFQAFIPYEEKYWGVGNPLVTAESW